MWPYDMNQGFPQMGGYGQQMGNGGFGQYQPQAPTGADQGNARIDKLKGRVSNLQEQMKGAGTQDMAGIQARMDKMQGRIKGLRQDRRQGEGMYGQPQGGAQPEPAMMGGGFNPNMGTRNPGGGFNPMYGGQMGGASQYGGGFPQGFGQMQNGYGMNPMQYGGGMYGGGMGGMGEGAFRGGGMNTYGGGFNQPWMQQPMNGGSMYNPSANQGGAAPQGANRPGMQYRQDRRQARQGEAGPGAPNPGATPVSPMQPQQGGWNPAWGTPTDQFGNATTVEAYNQRAANFKQNGIAGMMSPTDFQTKFGHLVPSSGGNGNVYKQNGGDGSTLYHYDPKIGDWKSMTADEYKGYGDYNYQSPLQSEDMARRAGAKSASNYW